ncbi:hypothetical protein Lal_00002193 [Lupinus albus]|uniref:Uncharacterized protein n=1 Tax=Lupinus albus TaxID=3870 RepID=A0A6A4PR15_LUPAL|nr:hypothetical protein Lalb_Chr11g0067451 [Lupinus albus]KAF1893680.1 hypothetical protein Lal_00002193 [Lupinus albus]
MNNPIDFEQSQEQKLQLKRATLMSEQNAKGHLCPPKIEIKKMEEDKGSEEELHLDSSKEKNHEEESSTPEKKDYYEDDEDIYSPKDVTPSSISFIACLKRKEDMKRFEETNDCFILDFDPSESLKVLNLSLEGNDDDADLSVVAEKGPVPCRDYPHSRHLCLKFPFSTTPHESCCEMCFCYVCDLAAPCKYWTQPLARHCNADSSCCWNDRRNMQKVFGIAEESHWW